MSNRDDDDDYEDERPRRPRYIRCAYGFCGADDCPTCHPGNFRGGIYIRDDENEED